MAKAGFIAELRRRHVVRVAIAYVVVSWLLLQLAAILFPAFGAPHWAIRLLFAFFVIGFPVALLLAWAFESTPDGVRRTVPADAEEARPASHGRRMGQVLNVGIIVVLAAAVGVLLWRQLGTKPKPQAARVAVAATAQAPASAAAPAQRTLIPAKSIAVLPFENLSADKANAYFASGMQDLILTKLADIGDLKVISRTSTMQYGSHPENLQTVGRQLGVATLLEGSVQRIGDQVLINVQLIDARTDGHIWAQSYQRTLQNVFGVEGEVAEKIATTLNAKLTAPEKRQLATAPTTNAAAYNAYLRARALENRSGNLTTTLLKGQVAAYREAVAHDPHFALAWAQLASAELARYWLGEPTPAVLAAAKGALAKAQALAPHAAATQLALGDYEYYGRTDYRAALVAFQNVLERAPNSVPALRRVARIERRLGRWQAAVTHERQALALDPRDVSLIDETANTFISLRDFARARALTNRALALSPGDPEALENKATIDEDEGRFAAANKVLAPLKADADTVQQIVFGKLLVHDYAGAVRVAREAESDPSCHSAAFAKWECSYFLGYAERLAGQAAGAQAALRRSVAAMRAVLAQVTGQRTKALSYSYLGLSEALLEQKVAALAAGHKAVAMLPPGKDALAGPLAQEYLTIIEARVGEREAAIELLRHLLTVPNIFPVTVPVLRAHPNWAPLHGDPRFQALLKEKPTGTPSAASAD